MSLVAPAFAPVPASIPITIEEGTVPSVEFSMKPRGWLTGYVVNTENGTIPAGVYREPDTEVQIQSITLRGGGITRTLIPLKEEDISYSDHYLSGTDYAAKGIFCFYGLTAGEYELTINANGYKQYSEMRNVRLWQYWNIMTIKLVEETLDHQ